MKRIRDIVWPWSSSSTLNQGFEPELVIKHPREEAEIIGICLLQDELHVFLEEHLVDRVGKDRKLLSFHPSKAGRFEIPEEAIFLVTVPLATYGAMHVYEANRPASLKIDPFYRPKSCSPLDLEPAPHTPAHKNWQIRETIRISRINAAIDGLGYQPDSLCIGYAPEAVGNQTHMKQGG